ncbi:response regulator [Caldalkalibacillus salinus]|uniref:response regulator n=1 Tax=Caldalkalibacillus salinus TaxID=2803787 RepID=UPI00192073F4|nr:response regulator [Caldalkalibacillus salinus]
MKKNILIVDDEPTTRQGLRKTIDVWAEGRLHIWSAENAIDALTILEEKEVHVLITDISMPKFSGLDLLEKINQQKRQPVVLIISAYSEFEYAQKAIEYGVTKYLLKPLNKRKLIQAVEQALEAGSQRAKVDQLEKVVDRRLVDFDVEASSDHDCIRKATDYIHEHIEDALSLKRVARHVHLNPNYFSVLFKEQTQMTFSEYVARSRLQVAKHLLLTTDLTIEDVSERVGYKTAKYFVKIFKDYEGMTPGRFRKI